MTPERLPEASPQLAARPSCSDPRSATLVGVLGGGQLGRMLALAGYPLGLRFRFLDPAAEAPAEHLAERVAGAYEDLVALKQFATGLDLVTYEFENIPVATARFLAQRLPVYPPAAALEAAQDRMAEKAFFQDLGIPTPSYAPVTSRAELAGAYDRIGRPAVLKTCQYGYDGKGQFVLHEPEDAVRGWEALGGGVPLILESFIPFDREVSLLAVRGRQGETAFYPLVENHHKNGMLQLSLAPAPDTPPELQALAEDYATRVLRTLEYVGVLAIEFFQHEGRLLANEMAPRVHNSGHWTIEGAQTSQFENHLRAILGLPLGPTAPVGASVMLNLIGDTPHPAAVLAVPGAHLHMYGKTPRPGRKLGHVTLLGPDLEAVQRGLDQLRSVVHNLW
jgi:5-(carboxyamino)imidazole ribonucleotide synthase